ncbi:hypothetical protein AL060_09710 [Pseudomonas syringae pv. rhaphiolepidis]|nr:hypothetical protein AL060_09710 [Pseudomonas syringae pv. rhaphiolepidis]
MPSFPLLHQFVAVNSYPFDSFLKHNSRGMSAHGLYELKANQYIQTTTGQMHMRRQVVFFPQLNPVFIPESVFSRHEVYGIAKLAIQKAALQFRPGHCVTPHSRTE